MSTRLKCRKSKLDSATSCFTRAHTQPTAHGISRHPHGCVVALVTISTRPLPLLPSSPPLPSPSRRAILVDWWGRKKRGDWASGLGARLCDAHRAQRAFQVSCGTRCSRERNSLGPPLALGREGRSRTPQPFCLRHRFQIRHPRFRVAHRKQMSHEHWVRGSHPLALVCHGPDTRRSCPAGRPVEDAVHRVAASLTHRTRLQVP